MGRVVKAFIQTSVMSRVLITVDNDIFKLTKSYLMSKKIEPK